MPRIVNATEFVANNYARSVTDCFSNSASSTSAIDSIAAEGFHKMGALE